MFKKITSFFYVLFLTLALTACGDNSPEKVAKNYVSFMLNGNIDKAFELVYVPESAKKNGDLGMVKGKLNMVIGDLKRSIEKNGGVKSINVENATYSADKTKATVKVQIIFGKDTSKPEGGNLKLIKNAGVWKVDVWH